MPIVKIEEKDYSKEEKERRKKRQIASARDSRELLKNEANPKGNKQCPSCFEMKAPNAANFYATKQEELFKDKFFPICRNCLIEYVGDASDYKKIIDILRIGNLPFYSLTWQSLQKQGLVGKDIFNKYLETINKNKAAVGFNDADKFFNPPSEEVHEGAKEIPSKTDDLLLLDEESAERRNRENIKKGKDDQIIVTQSMTNRWGTGYEKKQYIQLEKFYDEMITSHSIETPQHKKLLTLMCKLNLKMDQSLESDDIANFSKLHGEYQKILQTSGFRPIDKASSSDSSGIRSFSQIYDEVERDGFIEPYPLQEKQDIVDKTIMYLMNYTLKLFGMQQKNVPPVDTPKNDEMVEEYELAVKMEKFKNIDLDDMTFEESQQYEEYLDYLDFIKEKRKKESEIIIDVVPEKKSGDLDV